jgi:adenine deaminase
MFGETPRRQLVSVAMGEENADTVITGGTHVDVHSGELLKEDIAIKGDRIAVVGDVDDTIGDETTVIDAEGSSSPRD